MAYGKGDQQRLHAGIFWCRCHHEQSTRAGTTERGASIDEFQGTWGAVCGWAVGERCGQAGEQAEYNHGVHLKLDKQIDELHRHKILPVVVGGTAYWMQHLIFPNRLMSLDDPFKSKTDTPNEAPRHSPALAKAISSLPEPLLELFMNLPSNPVPEQAFAMHTLLTMLDPQVASRWHWRDIRKVLRSLEIIKEKGLLASEIMTQQGQYPESPRSVYRDITPDN